MPVKVRYILSYNGNDCEIECTKGTPLNYVWNCYKGYYLPGSVVTLIDDKGHSETFMRGMC